MTYGTSRTGSDHSVSIGRLMTQFNEMYSLAYDRRYGKTLCAKDENVATHSFFVVLAVLLLHEQFDFNLETALAIAVCHDLPEAQLTDISHDVKLRFPGIAAAFKAAEQDVVQKYPTALRRYFNLYGEDTPESRIVHLADSMQVIQYARAELSLGNINMRSVEASASNRIGALYDKVRHLERA